MKEDTETASESHILKIDINFLSRLSKIFKLVCDKVNFHHLVGHVKENSLFITYMLLFVNILNIKT